MNFFLRSFLICVLYIGHPGTIFCQDNYVLPDFSSFEKNTRFNQHVPESRDLKANADNKSDIIYDRIHWTVDPAINYIKGEVMTMFVPMEDVLTLDFDFASPLKMDSILYHGSLLNFFRNGDILRVQFPVSIPKATRDSITFYYQGAPVSTGFGSFNLTTHNGTPVLWTLTEPYNARDVWPCKQALTDKIDSIDIFITNPLKYKAASNGLLQSEITLNGQRTSHWKHRYPITTYLVCMAVTNYSTFSTSAPFGNASTTFLNYIYPESLTAAQTGIADNIKHMQLFDQLFGLYPFQKEKYGITQFSWGGGQEHQTMTFANSFGFELLAHELAHHWFGDKVTCASWQDVWLNEGFATYLSGLCYEYLLPQLWTPFKQGRIDDITRLPGGSVLVTDTTNINRIFDNRLTYNKGAMVIHMLRWICGDTAFFTGLRNYLNDPALAYGYANTSQLQSHLERTSGKNLDGFLADWFKGEGYPSYSLRWSQDASNQVFIQVTQKQSHPSVSYFELPLPIRLKSATGQIRDIVLNNSHNAQNFSELVGFKIASIEFDADRWLISKDNVIINDLVGTTDVKGIDFIINIVPNPIRQGEIRMLLQSSSSGSIDLSLISEDGRIFSKQIVKIVIGENKLVLRADGMPSGLYFLRAKSANKEIVKKIVRR